MLSSINLNHMKKIYDIIILIKWQMYILPKDPKNFWHQKLEKWCHKSTQINDRASLWEFQVLFMSTTWERLEITCGVVYSIKISVTKFFALGTSLIKMCWVNRILYRIFQQEWGGGNYPILYEGLRFFNTFLYKKYLFVGINFHSFGKKLTNLRK